METACETCTYFTTGPDFVPVLLRQDDNALAHHVDKLNEEAADGIALTA